ncbi:MAG TPA: DUF1565 domain-containing protein [Polyangiaceae bacterium]|jgi:hypothetical protein|nr:DUF1565 domain-containing protein [Polyangiaceae bacterium]
MRSIHVGWVCLLLACGGSQDTTDGGTDAANDVEVKPDTGVDASTDTGVDASCAAPTTTFYVDATNGSDTNNGGGATCAFKTITAALTASETHYNATIDVAAGTYAAGETFPLVVDHGRSLVGAGAGTTKIQGATTATYNTTNTGSLLDTGTHFVTMLAGDVMGGANSLGATTISGLTVLPPSTVTTPTANYLGIVCIAGNGPNTGATLPLPAPNLILKTLTVGPNFDTGVAVGSSPTTQTACNVAITTSTFSAANAGVITGACGTTNPALSWPSSQIGDGQPADANTFEGTVIGVFGGGCGSVQSFDVNKFTSGYRGIVLVSQASQYFEILGNTFDGTAAPNMGIGINTNASAVINKLNDNVFTNISESTAADTAVSATTGYAIALGAGNVLQAQRNAIHDNDNGLLIAGAPSQNFDFSSDGTLVNRNQFYCNSKVTTGNGYDVILDYGSNSAANFAGNAWDHAPPSTSVSTTTSTNATDIVTGTSGGATTTNYQAAITTACATGRSH